MLVRRHEKHFRKLLHFMLFYKIIEYRTFVWPFKGNIGTIIIFKDCITKLCNSIKKIDTKFFPLLFYTKKCTMFLLEYLYCSNENGISSVEDFRIMSFWLLVTGYFTIPNYCSKKCRNRFGSYCSDTGQNMYLANIYTFKLIGDGN